MIPDSPVHSRTPVPPFALLLSLGALAIPIGAQFAFPSSASEYEPLVWLLALVPAFLLSFYRGWRGAATALAAGMAVLSMAQVGSILRGSDTGNSGLLLVTVIVYVIASLAVAWGAELLHRSREAAEADALTDSGTGLPNRRHTLLFLEKEFAAAGRGRPLTIVLFDLDQFKRFNDTHGHAAGDEALRTFARVLDHCTRSMNLSGRFGGEEFLSIVSEATADQAAGFVRRVRETLALDQPREGPLTVSAGIAEYVETMESAEQLLAAADRALYQAKAQGRDCVRIADRGPAVAEEERAIEVPR